LKWYIKSAFHQSWRVDEMYIKVKGQWAYLYRAMDKDGDTIDFTCQLPVMPKRPSSGTTQGMEKPWSIAK